jgi:hypothetical protein
VRDANLLARVKETVIAVEGPAVSHPLAEFSRSH